MKTRVYVDGYNLYYGCLKGTAYKWLDLLSLFETQVLPSVAAPPSGKPWNPVLDELAVKFFTAPILERVATAKDSLQCQDTYHSALRKHRPGRVEIVNGYYALSTIQAKQVDHTEPKRPPSSCAETTVWKLEEKQSDVNLALHTVSDVLLDGVEHVVIVSPP